MWNGVFGEMESDEKAAGEEDLMGNGYLAFDSGVRGFLRAMPTGLAPWEFDVIGTEGRVRSLAMGSETQYYRWVEGGRRNQGLPARAPFALPTSIPGMGLSVIADLVRGIETGAQPRCSAEDGRKALEIAIALRESHRQGGRRVDLPLADRSQRILSVEIAQDAVPARIRPPASRVRDEGFIGGQRWAAEKRSQGAIVGPRKKVLQAATFGPRKTVS